MPGRNRNSGERDGRAMELEEADMIPSRVIEAANFPVFPDIPDDLGKVGNAAHGECQDETDNPAVETVKPRSWRIRK
jgi:hypothetical protein